MFGRNKKPKDLLSKDMGNGLFMAFMFFVSLFVKMWSAALLFLALSIFWFWHRQHLKKKFDKAVRDREERLSKMYGYDPPAESDGTDETYF